MAKNAPSLVKGKKYSIDVNGLIVSYLNTQGLRLCGGLYSISKWFYPDEYRRSQLCLVWTMSIQSRLGCANPSDSISSI